ncbi:MAG TPA: hypothetical protein VF590_03650, partial [Isosphaeraceae bacterium]
MRLVPWFSPVRPRHPAGPASRRRRAVVGVEPLQDRILLTGPGDVADDAGDTFAAATPVQGDRPDGQPLGTLARAGTTSISRRIDADDDVDVFQFTAPVTTRVAIALLPFTGQELPLRLDAFDGSHRPIEPSRDDVDAGVLARFPIVAGRTYFLRAAADGRTTGDYELRADVGDRFTSESLQSLALEPFAPVVHSGDIAAPGGMELFVL